MGAVEFTKNLVENTIDFHCHGVGKFDFTEIADIRLQDIENILAERNQSTILTLYLYQSRIDSFIQLIHSFHKGRMAGKYKHIAGIGLEGPLLASHGGTPSESCWIPTKREWRKIASCGDKGLVYVIFSPDAYLPPNGTNSEEHPDLAPADIMWVTETLVSNSVLPAAGHFGKKDPLASANKLQKMFDIVEYWGCTPTITDHFLNDMPHNFKHSWRTPAEQATRDDDIKQLQLDKWTLTNLEEHMGHVPATIVRNAHKGLVKVCQNFDGEHVDLSIVKRVVELMGAENMIMMTDSIESRRLAGRDLHQEPGTNLLYQQDGIVAAGSQDVEKQIRNMLSIGMSKEQIEQVTRSVPKLVLEKQREPIDAQVSCI